MPRTANMRKRWQTSTTPSRWNRARLIPIKEYPRVPMMQIYALFAGKAKPDEVLTAAKGGYSSMAQLNQQLFYAQFYVGLFYEASGNEKLARKHITQAAEEYKAD